MLDPNVSLQELRLRKVQFTNEEFYRYLIDRLRLLGFNVHEFTPYQFRVEGVLDVYPVNRRWHDIEKNVRGHYEDIFEFVLKFLGNHILRKSYGSKKEREKSQTT